MKTILPLLTLFLLCAASGFSQAPGFLNYQGVARNSVGNVLKDKAINLRLSIHQGTASGPVVYQESRATTTNPFGLFNVQIGSGGATNVTGTIAGVNWSTGNKFIQVEIDPNGGTSFINIGTAQLASVPYALYATGSVDLLLPFNKTQADNGTLFKITNSGDNTGSTALEGLTNSTAANAAAVIGTVTAAAPGSFSAGIRGINNSTTGTGIGVYGSQAGSGWGVYGISPSGIGVNGTSTSGTGVYGTSTTGRAGFFEITNSASTADALRAESNGTGTSWAFRAINSGSNGAGLFIQSNPVNAANTLQANQTGLGRAGLFNSTNAAASANAVDINVAGTGFALRLASSNAAPKSLQTAGGLQLTGINEANNRVLKSDAAGNATWADPSSAGIVTGNGTLNFIPKWTPNGTTLGNSLLVDNGSTIGLNTTTMSPSVRFSVHNATAGFFAGTKYTNASTGESLTDGFYVGQNGQTVDAGALILNMENSPLSLGTNGTDRLFISAVGNVGIGTGFNNPVSKLQVNNPGVIPGLIINNSNTANTIPASLFFNSNISGVNYGNSTVYAQRGDDPGPTTILYTGAPTSITGLDANTSGFGFGIQGSSSDGIGVTGLSFSGVGVHGINLDFGNAAYFANAVNTTNPEPVVVVENISTVANAYGIYSKMSGTSMGNSSSAIVGESNSATSNFPTYGVMGRSTGNASAALFGISTNGMGLLAQSTSNLAVHAVSLQGNGLLAESNATGSNAAMVGLGNGVNNFGVIGYTVNGTGAGGYFEGATTALRTMGGIQFTGINEGLNKVLTSDALGNATWKPAANQKESMRAKFFAGNLTIPSGTSVPVTQWNSISLDGTGTYNNVTGQYTVTAPGVYQINAGVLWNAFTFDATTAALEIWVNGVYETSTEVNVFGGFRAANNIAYEKRLNAGDKVSVHLFQNSGQNQTLNGLFGTQTFSLHLIHN